ncbi:methionyl-tRNA synthetase 1 [Arctopsyche grandis]|uniref:methionyl-tRNA synthetase 1 n=1 Tax=Arctopsyche grandis TaxID=121162 RepID=UPI00406D8006
MKMIIYFNESSTSSLKSLICAEFSEKKFEICKTKTSDGQATSALSPALQVDEEINFFSSNAACLYLLPIPLNDSNLLSKSSEWLEWESSKLSPAVLKSSSSSEGSNLLKYLKKISAHLESQNFILGGIAVSAVDISLWCTLYPIFQDDKCMQMISKSDEFANLIKWNERIKTLPQVQKALKEHPIKTISIGQLKEGPPSVKSAPEQKNSPDGSANVSPDMKVEVAVTEDELIFAKESWENGMKLLEKTLPDEKIILPKEGYKNILITSALPYVNNVPHLGNIIGCVLSADVFARYCRLCNYNALFICGTDEYGTATETKALEEGISPRQICDKYFEIHNSVYRWFGIGFDYFGRTTTPEQTEIAQGMFMSLYKNGFVETQTVEQLLCEKCNRFLADRFVEGTCPHPGCGYEDARGDQCDGCGKLINATELIKPRCKLCAQPPVLRNSAHFFLDLPQIEPLLQNWVASSESGWSNSAQQITRAWLKTGLKPRCITRDLNWGVPVPIEEFKSKVFYVWFDAPIGYLSITKRYTDQYEQWWKPDPKHNVTLYQFMAKDNVPFHSVVFPATLLGVGQKHVMVKHIMATEYLNYEDGKFSKSRGVGVFGSDAQDTGIPADIFRFYLLSIRPEGQDSNFSWVDLATRNNSELLNNFGNFVNRAIVFCFNSFNAMIPTIQLEAQDMNLLALINREIKSYVESMEVAKQRDALKHILNISRLGNQLMQSQQPWVLLKGTDDAKARAGTVVGLSCNISCLIGVLLAPFMPETARNVLTQLGTSLAKVGRVNPERPSFYLLLPGGHKIGKPSPLFTKIETAKVEELKKRFSGRQSTSPAKENADKLSIPELEAKILEQGVKVRDSKTSGADKSVWSPMVEVLLGLKAQLAQALKEDGKGDVTSAANTTPKNKKGSKKNKA